jgi:tRNA threonylcarbamoyladenosine biosynthesis protein TsaB
VILAIDTATRAISVALAKVDGLVAEETWQSDNNHTMELAPAVEKLLAKAGVKAEALTALAVAIGPGSFTGVRIGLGFAKGLALACDLKLIGVRTLDITIRALPTTELHAIAVVQAGRSRVIWGRYVVVAGEWQTADVEAAATETVGTVGTWDTVKGLARESNAIVVGEVDEVGANLLSAAGIRIASPEQNVRRAGRLAEIGWERWQAGEALGAALVQPVYAQQPTSGTV